MATIRLEVALWDAYVLLQRQRNHAVTANRLSAAGKLGGWRRWKKEGAVLAQIPVVKRIARTESRKFAAHLDLRDLVQSGMVGLLEASERYRPGRGGGFAQFAYFRIRGAIIDANKRRAYREELNDSLDRQLNGTVQGVSRSAQDGTVGDLVADRAPLAIELIIERVRNETLEAAILLLPSADAKLLRAWMESRPIREQCAISGMSANYTRLRIAQIQGRVRALLMKKPPGNSAITKPLLLPARKEIA
jgi:RNA polymerase sigma factor (sigma-70 family)